MSQLGRFTALAGQLKARYAGLTAHIANSAATMREPAAHFDMVRTGIAIYGSRRSATTRAARPAAGAAAELVCRRYPRGKPANRSGTAGASWPIARRAWRSCDRLRRRHRPGPDQPRRGADRRPALPIAGTISMDQLTVLLPDDPGAVRPATRSCSSADRAPSASSPKT